MRRRRVAAGVGAALATAITIARRRRRELIELHYDDGSMIALERGTPEGTRLLALSRDALDALGPG